jgi:hypothetical protein
MFKTEIESNSILLVVYSKYYILVILKTGQIGRMTLEAVNEKIIYS